MPALLPAAALPAGTRAEGFWVFMAPRSAISCAVHGCARPGRPCRRFQSAAPSETCQLFHSRGQPCACASGPKRPLPILQRYLCLISASRGGPRPHADRLRALRPRSPHVRSAGRGRGPGAPGLPVPLSTIAPTNSRPRKPALWPPPAGRDAEAQRGLVTSVDHAAAGGRAGTQPQRWSPRPRAAGRRRPRAWEGRRRSPGRQAQ